MQHVCESEFLDVQFQGFANLHERFRYGRLQKSFQPLFHSEFAWGHPVHQSKRHIFLQQFLSLIHI